MTSCPFESRRELRKLPKNSSCTDYKDVPARSSYWQSDTDSVQRCANWQTGNESSSDDDSKKSGPPGDGGGGGGDSDGPPDYPESVGKFEVSHTDFEDGSHKLDYRAKGFWNNHPAILPSDEPLIIRVSVRDHGGRQKHRISVDVRYWIGEKEGTPDHQSRVATRHIRSDHRQTFYDALEIAVEWMEDHQPRDNPVNRGVGAWERVEQEPAVWEAEIEHPFRGAVTGRVEIIEEEKEKGSVPGHKTTQTVYGHSYEIPEFGKHGRSLSSRNYSDAVSSAEQWLESNQPGDYEIDLPDEINGWDKETHDEERVTYRRYRKPPSDDPQQTQEEITLSHEEPSSSWEISAHRIDPDSSVNPSFTPRTLPDKGSSMSPTGGRSGKRQSFADPPKAWGYVKEYIDNNPEELIDYEDMPRFRVRGENKYLRGVTEIINREGTGPTAQGRGTILSVDGEGAIDFEGVDSSNVLMYETSLILGTLENVNIVREGDTVSADMKALAEVASDVNMTETFTLDTVYDDTQQNVPPKLRYSASSGEEKSVYMSADYDPVDVPELDRGPRVTGIPASRFKKHIRALSKIHDDNEFAVAYVTSPDEVYAVSENFENGERARARLTDDADVISYDRDTDRSVTFLSYNYLRTISLAPFRPSSTDITITQTLMGMDDVETNSPVLIEYEQRGGPVKLFLAPRVQGDDAPEWDLSQPGCPMEQYEYQLAEPLEAGEEAPGLLEHGEGDSVVWFFPNSDGCRCGSQALQFDTLAQQREVTIYGVTNDSESELREMKESLNLEALRLVPDADGELAEAYGVEDTGDGYERRVFFVRDGRINDVSDGVTMPMSQPDECPSETRTLSETGTLTERIEHPGVYIVTGKRGSGKSAAAFQMGDEIAERDEIKKVTVAMPKSAQKAMPGDWYHVESLEDAPEHSIVIVDESYMKYAARTPLDDDNQALGGLVNTSRHCQQTIVFVTQNSALLDKSAVGEADGLFIKEPGALHSRFERRAIRDLTEEAETAFNQLPDSLENVRYGYLYSDDYQGMVENDKPDWYDDEISRSFSGKCGLSQPVEENPGCVTFD